MSPGRAPRFESNLKKWLNRVMTTSFEALQLQKPFSSDLSSPGVVHGGLFS